MALLISTMGSACIGAFWFVPTFYASEFLQEDVGLDTIPAIEVTLSQAMVYAMPAVSHHWLACLWTDGAQERCTP